MPGSYFLSLRKNDVILENVEISAARGDVVGIVGHNGVGKSTLLEIVCGLKKEMGGSFLIDGKPASPKIRNRDTFLVMQNSDYQLFTESVEKELYLGSGKDQALRQKGLALLEKWVSQTICNNTPPHCLVVRNKDCASPLPA